MNTRSLGLNRVAAACFVAFGPTQFSSRSLGAAPTELIFSSIPFAPGNAVPTIGGSFQYFGRPFLSPDGTRWILGAAKEDFSDGQDLIIVGNGTSATGATTIAAETLPTPFNPTQSFDTFRSAMGILDNGRFAYGTTVTDATRDTEMIVRFNGVAQEPVVQSGAPSPVPGANFFTLDSAHLLNNSTVRYRSTITNGQQIIGSGATAVSQSNVTVPAGQLVAPLQTIRNFWFDTFSSSTDGQHYIWSGRLNGPSNTDGVIVVNGTVVAQEGAQLPEGQLPGVNVAERVPSSGDRPIDMSPNGTHWLFRAPMGKGTTSTQSSVVLHNGSIVGRSGTPIFASSSDVWINSGQTFFMNVVNDHGDMVLGGRVQGDLFTDEVLVHYGHDGNAFLLAREGDPLDLNGNGLFDDDAFIGGFQTDGGVLTRAGQFYVTLRVKGAANHFPRGNAFVVMHVPEPNALIVCSAIGAFTFAARRCKGREPESASRAKQRCDPQLNPGR